MPPVHAQISGSPALLWKSEGKAVAAILVIPGNPGICGYYEEYLEALHNALGRRCTILCLSLLGHQGSGPRPSGTSTAFGTRRCFFTVSDQIDAVLHAVDRLESLHEGRVPILLIGHSFGAYAAQRVFATQSHRIESVHYLFPALANIAQQPRAKRIQLLINPYGAVLLSWVAAFFALLPYFVVLSFVMLVTGMRGNAATITTNMIRSPNTVFNVLSMARDEMNVIRDFGPDTLRATAGAPARNQTVRAFWAPGNADSWAPTKARAYAEEQLHLEQVALSNELLKLPFRSSTLCRDMNHAFVLHRSKEMAEITAAFIATDLAARNARLMREVGV
ncbi:hypothetical protein MCUN1_000398 [Malassezia cuniculi]|uniref:Uncharacterized protein n=1 Tax=Malassezia cuniculi TaxID=948313 RepID=A0AAF0J513_9BASI|nr:hypothetical protein MCUN1_000398 [Malassezia cuniculi]